MKKIVFSCAAVAFGLAVLVGVNDAQEKAKFTIKEVMAKAMNAPKGEKSLCAKVASGEATAAEKEQLVELFTALHANMPKKGEADSWKQRTEALLAAAKSGDGKALKAAADCAGCHKLHKGK